MHPQIQNARIKLLAHCHPSENGTTIAMKFETSLNFNDICVFVYKSQWNFIDIFTGASM